MPRRRRRSSQDMLRPPPTLQADGQLGMIEAAWKLHAASSRASHAVQFRLHPPCSGAGVPQYATSHSVQASALSTALRMRNTSRGRSRGDCVLMPRGNQQDLCMTHVQEEFLSMRLIRGSCLCFLRPIVSNRSGKMFRQPQHVRGPYNHSAMRRVQCYLALLPHP